MLQPVLPLCNNYLTFEIVLRLRVVGAHDGRGLSPDHEEDAHAALGLGLEQLAQGPVGGVQLGRRAQEPPVLASERIFFNANLRKLIVSRLQYLYP